MKEKKLDSFDIEIAVVRHFNPRMNVIVPNVYWGLGFNYELDLLILRESGFCVEVEIKTSLSDVKADLKKSSSAHNSNKIRQLYFAIPEYLYEKAKDFIPERAGILTINKDLLTTLRRAAKLNKTARRLTPAEISKLYELGIMRIWTLKTHLWTNRFYAN